MRSSQLKAFAERNREAFLGDAVAPDVEQFLEKCKAEKNVARLYAQQRREHRDKRIKIVSAAAGILVVMAVAILAFPEARALADRVGAVIVHMFAGKAEETAKAKIYISRPDITLIESIDDNTQVSYSQYQYKDGTKIEVLQEESDTVTRLLTDQHTDIKYGQILGSRLEYVPDVDGYIGQFRYGQDLVTITVYNNSEDFFLFIVESLQIK